jgi:hypothetical protein
LDVESIIDSKRSLICLEKGKRVYKYKRRDEKMKFDTRIMDLEYAGKIDAVMSPRILCGDIRARDIESEYAP